MIDKDLKLKDGKNSQFKQALRDRHLFNRFKHLHPNTLEVFDPCFYTESDVSRWEYHIRQSLSLSTFPVIDNTDAVTAARQMADSRRVEAWEYMPAHIQKNYLKIADCYAGVQCYAVGSRVNGEYIESFYTEKTRLAVQQMREILGKSDKIESDYDYTVASHILIGRPNVDRWNPYSMPETKPFQNADFLRRLPPGEHKIKIPMWDFSKLPADKKQEAKEFFAAQQWGKLMQMHNDYELSQNHYCCDETPIIRWFKWAIENGKLD